jgi:hypothetical protein
MKLLDIDLGRPRKLYHPKYGNIEWVQSTDGSFGLLGNNYFLYVKSEIFDDKWEIMDDIDIRCLVLKLEQEYGMDLENLQGMDIDSYRSLRNYICGELQKIIDEKLNK